jgi:hypothetical protein
VSPLQSNPPVVTVNERAARSNAILRLGRHDHNPPCESTIAALYALEHKGRTIEEWAEAYGQSALKYGITSQTQHTCTSTL